MLVLGNEALLSTKLVWTYQKNPGVCVQARGFLSWVLL